MTALRLRGRIALVTGGSRGIGAAISRALAEAGATVAINYRERADEADRLAEALRKTDVHAITIAADVSQRDAVAKMVEVVKSEFGTIDILINNAGVAITRGIDDLSETDFDRTISVNLKSVFLCTQAVLPLMRAQKWGRIVNISSGAAHDEGPGKSGRPDPARPFRKGGRGRHRRDDADRQSLHDRPDGRDERRHGVQLIPAATVHNSSCPRLSRASTSCFFDAAKTWMAGTKPVRIVISLYLFV